MNVRSMCVCISYMSMYIYIIYLESRLYSYSKVVEMQNIYLHIQ